MKYKIFVDGQEGTTGLKIHERLAKREDLEVLKIDSDKRKDLEARKALINEADIVFLCLPDAASKESASLVNNDRTRLIDASTAFRTDPEWVYGLPELGQAQKELIKNAKKVSNPGCHATGFNLAVYPLIKEGIVPKDYPFTCQSLTGYSGAGKKMIETYDATPIDDPKMILPRPYALGLTHKHLPEMQKVCGLDFQPIFTPIIGRFYQGMSVLIPLSPRLFAKKMGASEMQKFFAEYYANQKFIRVMPYNAESNLDNGFLISTECNNTNRADIFVFGHDEQILLVVRIDNLGKGASGAAVQNMNIMLGLDEEIGL